MKQFFLYVAFCLTFILVSGTSGSFCLLAESDVPVCAGEKDSCSTVAEAAKDPCITVCIAANSFADVTVAQSPGFSGNLARRYRPAGFSIEKLFTYQTLEKGVVQVNTYKNALYDTQKYSALLKLDGYYIYALRKIII